VQLDGPDPVLAQTVGAGAGLISAGGSGSNPNWYYQKTTIGTPGSWPIPRGYQPKGTTGAGTLGATGARINGYRIHGWIKVELVRVDAKNNIRSFDITQEMLNLGVTVPYRANAGFYYPRTPAGFP